MKQIFNSSKLVLSTLTTTLILGCASLPSRSIAGERDRGGGSSEKNNLAALKQLFENDAYYLKTSMLNYLETLDVNQIPEKVESDKIVKSFFTKISKIELKNDINRSKYLTSNNCFDKHDSSITAQAGIGDLNGDICFDIEKFYLQNKDRSNDVRLIQLASLAFHEEVHHFQPRNSNDIKVNEQEAYAVSAYILNTAVIGQMPVLKWSDPKTFEGEIITEHFTGDKAKALLMQLRTAGGHFDNQNNIFATNLKCEKANLVLIKMDPKSTSVPKPILWPWVGCSADPKMPVSALESYVADGMNSLGMSAMSLIVVGVQDRTSIEAIKLSCVDNSDRCTLVYHKVKQ